MPVSVYFRDPGYYLEPWLLTPLGTAATHAQMAYNTVHRRCELSSKDALVCWSRGSCASTRLETHCSTQLIKRVSCSSPLLWKTVLAKYFAGKILLAVWNVILNKMKWHANTMLQTCNFTVTVFSFYIDLWLMNQCQICTGVPCAEHPTLLSGSF